METTDQISTDNSASGELAEIGRDDALARAIFHKTAFSNDAVSANALLAFRGDRNKDGSFDESLYLMRLISPDGIHDDGCNNAAAMNERARAKRIQKGKDPEPVAGEDKRYYCGFTSSAAQELDLPDDNYVIELTHAPMPGMVAHVSIYIRPKTEKKLVGNDLTQAGRLLALKFANPQEWICEVDATDPDHPVTKCGPQILSVHDRT